MMDPPSPDERPIGAWNLVVTAQEGEGRRLRRALRPLVSLEWSPFRNVAFSWVSDQSAFLEALGALWTAEPRLACWLGKVIPVDATFVVDESRLLGDLERITTRWLARLAGGTFHARVVRRGHKGTIDSPAIERELGARLVELTQSQGAPATVTFGDPDFIIDVELVGEVGGVALLSRALRARHAFVRAD